MEEHIIRICDFDFDKLLKNRFISIKSDFFSKTKRP